MTASRGEGRAAQLCRGGEMPCVIRVSSEVRGAESKGVRDDCQSYPPPEGASAPPGSARGSGVRAERSHADAKPLSDYASMSHTVGSRPNLHLNYATVIGRDGKFAEQLQVRRGALIQHKGFYTTKKVTCALMHPASKQNAVVGAQK